MMTTSPSGFSRNRAGSGKGWSVSRILRGSAHGKAAVDTAQRGYTEAKERASISLRCRNGWCRLLMPHNIACRQALSASVTLERLAGNFSETL